MNQNMNRESQILNIRIDEIIPNRFQPRLAFNEAELKELSESIKMHGIIQPLVLRRIGDKYEIIAGERRYKASVMAGLTTVPAIIMNIDDKQSAEVAVVENLQRKNLTAIEEAQSYKKILDMGYLTQEELAARMGVSQPTIANKLRLLNLEKEVQDSLLRNQISERHARSLLSITDRSIQVNMLNRIIKERLTVRQTDDEINKILGKTTTPSVVPAVEPTPKPVNPIAQETNIFDRPTQPITPTIDTNKIREEAKDIIPPREPRNIDMLLRKENETSVTDDTDDENNGNRKISLEDTATNMEMGEITTKSNMAINPFQEITPEIMSFDVPSQSFEKPTTSVVEPTKNSLIEEFRQQQTPVEPRVNTVSLSPAKGISQAISSAREEVKKIESLGFNVDTEEFDFEDMYQIIIKIKKD